MGWKVTEEWAPYVNIINHLAGYTETYDTYTLVTLHGLGHSAVYQSLITTNQIVTKFITQEKDIVPRYQ